MDIIGHQEIKCNVKSCSHNDNASYCNLRNITIGNNATVEPHEKSETLCASFDCM